MSYNTKTNSWNDENKMALFVRPEIKKNIVNWSWGRKHHFISNERRGKRYKENKIIFCVIRIPFVSLAFNVKLHHSPWLPNPHHTEVYITIGIWKKCNSSRKLYCCCFFTSCFLFPIAGQPKAKQRFVSPNSGDKKTKPCVNIFREKFNPSTLKRIEEGNWFILYYFYSIFFYLFCIYFQLQIWGGKAGCLIETGAYSI